MFRDLDCLLQRDKTGHGSRETVVASKEAAVTHAVAALILIKLDSAGLVAGAPDLFALFLDVKEPGTNITGDIIIPIP